MVATRPAGERRMAGAEQQRLPTSARQLAAPSIGRYGFGPPAATICASARRTESSTGMRPSSSK